MTPTTPTPLLLAADERGSLARVLDHVGRFDVGGFAADARALLRVLDDPQRTGDDVAYSYSVVGPWGVDSADSEAAAVAEVRKARAEHWAEGHGRDDRYHSIEARRTARIYFNVDAGSPHTESTWEQDGGEVIDIPDTPLTAVEEIENQRRLDHATQRAAAMTAYLRESSTRIN